MTRIIELFDAFCNVYIDRDVARLMRSFLPDATLIGPGINLSGRDAIEKFFESEIQRIEDYSVDKRLILKGKDELAVEWRVRYRYQPTGKEIHANGVTLIKADKGLIKSLRDYTDLPPSFQ